MNPWNALLEGMHSALIDELNTSLPEIKPELGLPSRKPGFVLPNSRISEVWAVDVSLPGASPPIGRICLGITDGSQTLQVSAEALFASIWERATQQEFTRRGIQPSLKKGATQSEARASGEVKFLIWMPMRVSEDPITLGVGVY